MAAAPTTGCGLKGICNDFICVQSVVIVRLEFYWPCLLLIYLVIKLC